MIHSLVSLVFHKYDANPEGAHKVVELPMHIGLSPPAIINSAGLTFIGRLEELEHPLELVTVTE